MNLQTPVKNFNRSCKLFARRLEKLGITKFEDFLFHIPFRYDDFTLISKINRVQPGETVTIRGTVSEIKNAFTKNFKKLQKAEIADESGTIEVVWFNQPYLTNVIHAQDKIALSGKIDWFLRRIVMQSPDYEIITNQPAIHTGRLVPVYPETKGITSKWLRRQIYNLLKENIQQFTEYLPDEIIKNNSLLSLKDAIEQIHFPSNIENVNKAKQRLSFDELFLLQMSSMKRKADWDKNLTTNQFQIEKYRKQIMNFIAKLPFSLTAAQNRVVQEIFNDLCKEKPMNRLLEGDVGSGKTVVSAITMYLAFLNGFQSVLMAPTEILANQHYQTISKLLTPLKIKVGLATGNQKKEIKNFDVIVGTHAVLEKEIIFDRLGLVVIDEQQRFGVEQRAIIRSKGKNPHLLTMTATPIPRTIALTLYGDLDLSVLDEMPRGRKQIKTWLVPAEKRSNAYLWIEKQIKKNKSQAFIVCPFIEESESMQTIKAATKEFDNLKNNIFKHFNLGLLHGKIKSKEKEKVLDNFKNKKIDILVATPVVEVGIDFPNATIIMIETSERFGLAQLHQLRGRVGRGEKQSYCLLFTESLNNQTQSRLKAMETCSIGAKLAELDLQLRGPGEIFGTMQHGRKMLKIASFSDFDLIKKVKIEAEKIFHKLNSFPKLMEKIKNINMKQISAD